MAFLPAAPLRTATAQGHSRTCVTRPETVRKTFPARPSLFSSKIAAGVKVHMSAIRPVRTSHDASNRHADLAQVATSRAITPMRRPSQQQQQSPQSGPSQMYTEQQPLPSQRRSDLMAPQRVGFWSLVPYAAATVVALFAGWIVKKRFVARQDDLVDEFGQVVVMYGNTPDTKREITSEYKRKLGPGILRGAMFSSFLNTLLAEKAVVPTTIQDVAIIKALLKLSDQKTVSTINELGAKLKDAPSLLGKLLFIAERVVAPDAVQNLTLVPLFPYGPSTVTDLQRNMLERCYCDFVGQEIDQRGIEEPPMAAAAALRLDPTEAKSLFDGVVVAKIRQKEKEATELAAAEAEEASKPDHSELDYPARSGEPAKAAVHAYQCSDCGYTLFPAAGREFKFYGDDFVCPACGAPKDRFVDLNTDE